ncbi:MAG: BlaI/MecI/CopY family transcriptional regulator [Bacteroidota bacterium]
MSRSWMPLGKTELEIMNHMWELEEATVSQIHKRILEKREVAYTTIMTVMKNLTDKKVLKYRKEGAKYVYTPVKMPDQLKERLASDIINAVFKGSASALIQTLAKQEKLSDQEKKEIRDILDNMEGQS